MKISAFICASLLLFSSAALAEEAPYQAKIEGAKSLFNGKDLTGWKGNPDLWSVKDGVIFGTTHVNKTKGNTFLILDSEDLADFHLSYEARHEGNNSGVMYRSLVINEENFVMKGYQCDLHPNPPYCAMIYGEKERGIIVTRGQTMTIDEAGKKTVVKKETPEKVDTSKWQTYEIICQGNKIIQKVNGKVAVELTDNWENRIKKGKIGIQLHAGKPMNVYVRNVQLKKLD